ncbi:MAG: hypothetical protein WB557_35025, partial [Solirubrobacteraceae bacterium]
NRRSPTRQPPGSTSPKPQYLQAIHRHFSPPRGSLEKSRTRAGAGEIRRSASKRQFVREVARYVPAVEPADVLPAPAGVRAQAIDRDGSLVDDFRLATHGNVTWVRNAPSPAATSSLAIAEELVSDAV